MRAALHIRTIVHCDRDVSPTNRALTPFPMLAWLGGAKKRLRASHGGGRKTDKKHERTLTASAPQQSRQPANAKPTHTSSLIVDAAERQTKPKHHATAAQGDLRESAEGCKHDCHGRSIRVGTTICDAARMRSIAFASTN